MINIENVIALLAAYLLGSIPTAVWIGKYFYNFLTHYLFRVRYNVLRLVIVNSLPCLIWRMRVIVF